MRAIRGPRRWQFETAQRLSITEALDGFTNGAAYAASLEDRLGKLAPTYLADLLVLDQDAFTCPPGDIKTFAPWLRWPGASGCGDG